MKTLNDKAGSLYTYIQNNTKLGKLRAIRGDLDSKLETIDHSISLLEDLDCPNAVEDLTMQYNELNLYRIQIDLEINRLKREVLLFELEAALAD